MLSYTTRILPGIVEPEANAKIWRYMNIARLHDLLLNKRLSFSLPKRFEDYLEGAYTDSNIHEILAELDKGSATDAEILFHQLHTIAEDLNPYADSVYITCWQLAEYECISMWKNYADYREGIAIQTRYSRLKACLNHKFYIGQVSYCENQALPKDALQRYFCKRKGYEDEREVRAIYFNKYRYTRIKRHQPVKSGDFYYHLIQPQKLIERIIVSPYASDETVQSVRDITQQYGIKSQHSRYRHENPLKMKALRNSFRKTLKKIANQNCISCGGKGYIKKYGEITFCQACNVAKKWEDIKPMIRKKALSIMTSTSI